MEIGVHGSYYNKPQIYIYLYYTVIYNQVKPIQYL